MVACLDVMEPMQWLALVVLCSLIAAAASAAGVIAWRRL